jgi:hypothetical protein
MQALQEGFPSVFIFNLSQIKVKFSHALFVETGIQRRRRFCGCPGQLFSRSSESVSCSENRADTVHG